MIRSLELLTSQVKGPKLWAQVLERGGMFRHQIRPRAPEVQNVFNKEHLNSGRFLVQVELRLRLGQYSKPYLSKPPIGRIPFGRLGNLCTPSTNRGLYAKVES